jgi:hypothetical protein
MGFGINTPQNAEVENGWNLIFENQNNRQTFNIKISEQKYIKEVISLILKILVNKNQQNNIRKRKLF